MVQLTINKEGSLYVEQRCVAPTVYLDHWAWRKISEDQKLAVRFSEALRAREGTLALSWLNLVEFIKVTYEHQRRAADALLSEVSPHFFAINPDFFKVIRIEDRLRAGEELAEPHADLQVLRAFLELSNPKSVKPFSLRNLFQLVPARIARKLGGLADSVIEKVKSFRKEYAENRDFLKRVDRLPRERHFQRGTRVIASELIGLLLKDGNSTFSESDAIDLCHAVVPLAYCDYVLLDRRWTPMVERAQMRIRKGGLTFRVAKAVSEKNNGLEGFLKELESGCVASAP